MMTFAVMTGLVLVLLVFGTAILRDLFRQTEAWSRQHPDPGVPLRQHTGKFRVLVGPAGRWTALDDLQLTRLLRDHR